MFQFREVQFKGAIGEMKKGGAKVGELETQIKSLQSEKADLEKKIKEGAGDEGLKSKVGELERTIADKEKTITDLQGQVSTTKEEWEGKLKEVEASNLKLALDFQFEKATQSLKFSEVIPEAARNASLKTAKEIVLAKGKPEFFEDETGNKNVRFRDENGHIISNPENLQNPFTLSELYTKELQNFGIIAQGKKQGGAGTKGGSQSSTGTISINGAKTKSEASSAIKDSLMSQGISTNHPEYQAKFDEAYNTPEIQQLPLR